MERPARHRREGWPRRRAGDGASPSLPTRTRTARDRRRAGERASPRAARGPAAGPAGGTPRWCGRLAHDRAVGVEPAEGRRGSGRRPAPSRRPTAWRYLKTSPARLPTAASLGVSRRRAPARRSAAPSGCPARVPRGRLHRERLPPAIGRIQVPTTARRSSIEGERWQASRRAPAEAGGASAARGAWGRGGEGWERGEEGERRLERSCENVRHCEA